MSLQTSRGHYLGRAPDLGDFRDHPLTIAGAPPWPLPRQVDHRSHLPSPGNQGELGSCTAWASLAAFMLEMHQQHQPPWDPSELAQYYWTRVLEGTIEYDSGASIRNAVKALATYGAVPESLWPYDIDRFSLAPDTAASIEALHHQALVYQRVAQNLVLIRRALAAGYALVFGVSVYESFDTPQTHDTGRIPLPGDDESMLGGHALTLVGYNDDDREALFRNSWGSAWGEQGHGYLPYTYLLNPDLASDFWVIKRVEV